MLGENTVRCGVTGHVHQTFDAFHEDKSPEARKEGVLWGAAILAHGD